MKRCYRTWLRKCSDKIQTVEELLLFSLEEMFPFCILEMERALLPCQFVPLSQSENLHLAQL